MLILLAGGLSNKEIATEMGVTVGTAKQYLALFVFPPLGVTSRFEAALWALRNMELLKASA